MALGYFKKKHFKNRPTTHQSMDTLTHSLIKNMSPQFLVADLDNSVDFYTKNLRFTIDFRYGDFYVGIIKDGFSIHLKTGKPSVEERKNKRGNKDLDITFCVDNIEDLYNDILNRPIEIIQPLRSMPYGKEFYLVDPDGYIIAFLQVA
jgi:predicted enzyme related to lactoylglutathione lyase